MPRKSRAKRAEEIAEAVAKSFLEDFGSVEKGYRGPKFVWPETYIEMVGRFTELQCGLAGMKPDKNDEELGRRIARRVVSENPNIK